MVLTVVLFSGCVCLFELFVLAFVLCFALFLCFGVLVLTIKDLVQKKRRIL